MITVARFERMSGVKTAELIDGRVVEKNGGGVCGYVGAQLGCLLSEFVHRDDCGYVCAPTAGYACFPHRPQLVRKPSVSFVRKGRFANETLPLGLATIVPNLVVLIVAPDDTFYEIEDKLNDYLLVRVPLIWVVNPDIDTVHVYAADGTVRRLTADQDLTGDPVLPGFRVRIADFLPPRTLP